MTGRAKIGLISAMKMEIDFAGVYLLGKKDWVKVDERTFVNEAKGLEVITRILGVGKVNAASETTRFILEEQPELIINVGFAGGLADGSEKGDIAIGKSYVQEDLHIFLDENKPLIADASPKLIESLERTASDLKLIYHTGTIATGDYFLHRLEDKNRIKEEYDAVAFDMESAAIAQVATAYHIGFISIRTFSDLADEEAVRCFEETAEKERIPIEQRPIILAIETIERHGDFLQNNFLF